MHCHVFDLNNGMRYTELLFETAAETFYHGTSLAVADYIQLHGFATSSRLGGMAKGAPEEMRQFSFLTPSKSVARWYALNRIGDSEGAVLTVTYPARSYDATSKPMNVYGALDQAGREFEVAYIIRHELNVTGIVAALRQHGYNAMAFRDADAGGKATLMAFDPKQIALVKIQRLSQK